jgi:hypothetical protein
VSLDALATRIKNSKLLPQFCRKNLVGVSYWVEDDEGGGTMFAWILILSSWGALLSLILHDATKEDTYGSAILIAARKIKAFTFWAMLEARKQALALPPTKKWLRKDGRVSMTAPALELAILESVKKAAPGCQDFVGVIVQHNTPQSHLDANWAIRGVKFGRADRPVADEALATVVERMQREFLLSKD